MKFDVQKFMEFKVNTYVSRTETGGCIKCAALYALGEDVSGIREARFAYTKGWAGIPTSAPHPQFVKFGGLPFKRLLDTAETTLLLMWHKPFIPLEERQGATISADQEAQLKKFVLDGMVELGLIEQQQPATAEVVK